MKILSFFVFVLIHYGTATPCQLRAFKTGLVCVCNSTNCDTFEFNLPKNDGEVLILSTSKSGLRYFESRTHFNAREITIPNGPYHYSRPKMMNSDFKMALTLLNIPTFGNDEPIDSTVNVSINKTAQYQNIIGFGGAFTGAVSFNLKQLATPELRHHVYRSFYSKDVGIGYNLMRLPIGGCDFDLEPWAYNEYPEHDPLLTGFTKLDKRDLEKIEHIEDLKKVTNNYNLKFFGAAWSPPRWMKTNGDWSGFSALRLEYYQTWADYHVRYLELMHESNFSFWAISTGNEPLNGVLFPEFVRFMSLGWTPTDQGKWVSENLGPSLRKSATVFNVKVLAGDDQRYTFPWWFEKMYDESPDVAKYVDGFAVHWYADKYLGPKPLDEAAFKYPNKFIIATEASSGDKPWDVHKPILGYWQRCEDYVTDIIEDMNHYVAAWTDWNLMLDEHGGPNYARNFIDAPIITNVTEFYKQPIFYAIGHFSRFIIPDSVRIYSKPSHRFIKSTAFLRPDGYIVVVLYNTADMQLDVNVFDKSYGALRVRVPGKSIHTLIYR